MFSQVAYQQAQSAQAPRTRTRRSIRVFRPLRAPLRLVRQVLAMALLTPQTRITLLLPLQVQAMVRLLRRPRMMQLVLGMALLPMTRLRIEHHEQWSVEAKHGGTRRCAMKKYLLFVVPVCTNSNTMLVVRGIARDMRNPLLVSRSCS
jgi:hypothetical protein